jgi:peptide/nickel transport system substrate-binding protein
VTGPASRTAKLILLAGAAALTLSACGTEEPADTSITISLTRAADHLDPALASQSGTLEPLWLVYTPLLTYRHAEGERGAELIPGLASNLPEVSADGRTYTLYLRQGLSYSDGGPVRASDFEHAISRVRELNSKGARFYRGIAGIEADDESGRITIELTAPDRDFADALALPFAAPVPARTPFRDLTAEPPPGVGPYEITATEPDGGFVLSRSPDFSDLDIPDIPTGNLAEIRTTVVPSELRQAQDVLDGKIDYMQDPPPAQLLPTILDQASDRFTVQPTASTAYFFLDKAQAPFDDPLVREAVNTGLDREAVARAYGERMQPGCALLAPGVPGYDRELDTNGCPYGDPADALDLGGARALIEQAGAAGARVTVTAGSGPDARAATRAYASSLEAIGLEARIEPCAACAQTGLRVWAPDFPRAPGFFASLGLEDPLVASELSRLGALTPLDASADEWSKLDRYVVSPPQSYIAALGHLTATTFFSERMDPQSAIFSPVYRNDYSSWQLNEGE